MAGKKKKALLSKSTFIKGLQCRKALYLYKNRYFLRDPLSPEQRAKFVRGTRVGIYAQHLFPGGIDASPATHFQMAKSVDKTADLIAVGQTEVIYEAAFAFDDVVVALDILYRKEGKWYGVEVKSSMSISETYQWDAALQYYVINGSGLLLEDFSIAYMNKDYVKDGPIDPWKLFVMESRLEDVKQKNAEVDILVAALKETIALKSSPDIPIGKHCNDPYPCEFIGHCWKKVPHNSVFLLSGVDEAQKFSWYQQGLQQVDQLPEEITSQPWIASQLESIHKQTPVVDREKLSAFLHHLNKKQLFLESFTYRPAIPQYDGMHPYQLLSFSLACMPLDDEMPEIILMQPGVFSMKRIITHLLTQTKDYELVWVFNLSVELALLDQYSQLLPELADSLKLLKGKMKSLRQPLDEDFVVFPTTKPLKNTEDILTHFGANAVMLPKNLVVPQEADALYQKIAGLDDAVQKQEGLAQLEQYIRIKMKNLKALHALFLGLCS